MLSGRFQPPQLGEISAETDQLVTQLKQQNPQLQPGAAADVTVNQVRGRSLQMTNSGAAGGGAEHDWLVALPEQAGTLRYVVFVAPEADFSALRPTFERMLRTLKLAP
jgi:beta-barrel assembly-enhancing protease